jgi:uncharacterized protein
MRKHRRLYLFLLWTILLSPFAHAEKVADLPEPTGYVNDFAGVLSPEGKTQMVGLCSGLREKAGVTVVVVTVKTLEGQSVDSFASQLFNRWKIGNKETNRGVLLLLAIHDRKWRIEVGYGLESTLTDALAKDIGTSMVPDLRLARYDDAVMLGLHGIAKIVVEDARAKLNGLISVPAPGMDDSCAQATAGIAVLRRPLNQFVIGLSISR